MHHIPSDSYICPSCGFVFARTEMKTEMPDKANAIDARKDIHCISCGKLGMCYQANLKPSAIFFLPKD